MKYDFDQIINRKSTHSAKWSYLKKIYGDEDVLPMWVADMDFKSPNEVIKAMEERVRHGIFGYTGIPKSFYKSISNWVKKRHGWNIDEEWIVFTPGVVTGLNLAVLSFSKKGDKIVLQPPIYPPFYKVIEKNGRKVLNNPLKFNGIRYIMDIDDLEKNIDEDTKILFLCSPHNPVGRVWDEEELKRLEKVCLEKEILVVSDEIHGDIIYSGNKHIPIASISDDMAMNTITLMAPSKTFNIAGLHTSLAIIPNEEIRKKYKETINLIGANTTNIFGLLGLEAAYNYGEEWLDELLIYLEGNLNFLMDYIEKNISEIKVVRPEGTFLIWLDFRELGLSDEQIKDLMINKAKIGLNHGPTFGIGGSGFQRLNIGCPRSILEEGLSRIKNTINNL